MDIQEDFLQTESLPEPPARKGVKSHAVQRPSNYINGLLIAVAIILIIDTFNKATILTKIIGG